MGDKEKDTGTNNSSQNSNNNNQDRPQSYETVLKGLKPFKPISYGTERIVQSKRFDSDMEESNE